MFQDRFIIFLSRKKVKSNSAGNIQKKSVLKKEPNLVINSTVSAKGKIWI